MRNLKIAGFLAVALTSAPAHAAPIDRVREIIGDSSGIAAPGCVVGAFRNGEPFLFHSSAAADLEGRRAWNANTQFYAASMSKQFTVLAAAKLIEQGKLHLEDDVRRWVPELPEYQAPVTVEMLIHHTSGIRNWMELVSLSGVLDVSAVDQPTALRLVLLQTKTNFVPGNQYAYSNGGYLLLAEIIARASGTPFHEVVRRNVLEPLGMQRSFMLSGSRPRADNFAHGYTFKDGKFEVRDNYPLFGGSGGLITSIADLGKYIRDIQVGHKVWTPTVARIMLTPGRLRDGGPVVVDNGSDLYYAGGLQVGLRAGRYWVRHAGGVEGFSHMFALLPDRNLGVVLACNRGDVDQFQKSDAIVEAIEGKLMPPGQSTPAVAVRRSPVDLSALAGDYRSADLPVVYRLSVSGKTLSVTRLLQWPGIPASSTPVEFVDAGDGSYSRDRARLIPDPDGMGFTLSTVFVQGTHFKRSSP